MEAEKNSTNCSCPDARVYKDVYTYCFHGKIHIQEGRWTDDSADEIETIRCPFGYCRCKSSKKYRPELGGFCAYSCGDDQCIENRTGILCSTCKEGTSVWMGSEKCAPCGNNWWILVLIFILLSVVVMALLYFSFDAFSGYLNAFLYSYQMMPLFIPKHVEKTYGWTLFIVHSIGMQGTGGKVDFCLFPDIDNLDKLLINYTFAGYTLLFSFLIGILLPENIWKRIFKHLHRTSEESIVEVRKKAFGRAISLVLVLCYSSITHITLDIFDRVDVRNENRVYKAADIIYNTGKHKKCLGVASVVAIFVVLGFPFALVISPLLEKQFPTLYHRRAIFSALRCCFKEGSTIFAVFYFICRLILLIVAVYIKTDITRLLVLSVCCILFFVIFGIVQPYKEDVFNFWDTLLLANLCFMSNTSLIFHIKLALEKINLEILVVLFVISVYLPLLTLICRLSACLYRQMRSVWRRRAGKTFC